MTEPGVPASLDTIAHVIQVALTPVFLLSGIATLLNVFGARLAKVSDQADALEARIETAHGRTRESLARQMARLQRRALILDVAVILGSLAGIAVCGAVLTLFVGALGDRTLARTLFALFGLGILCTLCALASFGVEMLIASRGVRLKLDLRERDAGGPGGASAPGG